MVYKTISHKHRQQKKDIEDITIMEWWLKISGGDFLFLWFWLFRY